MPDVPLERTSSDLTTARPAAGQSSENENDPQGLKGQRGKGQDVNIESKGSVICIEECETAAVRGAPRPVNQNVENHRTGPTPGPGGQKSQGRTQPAPKRSKKRKRGPEPSSAQGRTFLNRWLHQAKTGAVTKLCDNTKRRKVIEVAKNPTEKRRTQPKAQSRAQPRTQPRAQPSLSENPAVCQKAVPDEKQSSLRYSAKTIAAGQVWCPCTGCSNNVRKGRAQGYSRMYFKTHVYAAHQDILSNPESDSRSALEQVLGCVKAALRSRQKWTASISADNVPSLEYVKAR